jgi:hypothetical protein
MDHRAGEMSDQSTPFLDTLDEYVTDDDLLDAMKKIVTNE